MKRTLLMTLAVLLAGCQQKIQHGLDEAQANEIEALLVDAGIEAAKAREGGRDATWAIAVPAARTSAAIRLLTDHDLPRKRAPGFAEVFGKGSMVPTSVEENALYVHALAGEISQTLSTLQGVAHARVHVVAAPGSSHPGFRQTVRPRAAVLLKARPSATAVLELRRSEIQQLVAGSVEGLDPANVAVMISEVPSAPAPVPSSTGVARWPLLIAALFVALLSTALVITLLHARRLRSKLAAPPVPVTTDSGAPAAKNPDVAKCAA